MVAPPPLQQPQPTMSAPAPLQPQPPQSPIPSVEPKKKKTALILTLVIAAVALLVVGAFAFVIIKKPKEFTGNYTKFAEFTSSTPSDAGSLKFKYPTNMVVIRDEPNSINLEQKSKADQLLKTQEGWESRVYVRVITGEFDHIADAYNSSSLTGNNETISYFARIHAKVLEEDGMSDIKSENREDLSNVEAGKIVYDYQYKDKNGVLVKARHVTLLNKSYVVGFSVEAIDKIWDKFTPAWDDITESLELQPSS